jgi:hypothetical protein
LRRVQTLAKRERFDGVIMLNIWALRATDSAEMRVWYQQPRIAWWQMEMKNEKLIHHYTGIAEYTICAWGVDKTGKGERVKNMLSDRRLHHLGLTKAGCPKHPLYLANNVKITPWS